MTSIRNAAVSISCAAVCLDSEETGCNGHARSLFNTAAKDGKLDVLKWGEKSGYELKEMLGQTNTIADAALHGHLEVVKYHGLDGHATALP